MVSAAASAFADFTAVVGNARVVRPRTRRLMGLWRYDRNKGTWDKVALPADENLENLGDLYWAEWQEDGCRSSSLVRCGTLARSDLMLGSSPKVSKGT